MHRLIASLLSFNAYSLDERIDHLGEEERILMELSALITVVVAPPTVIGAGRASLAIKFMKLCHSLRMLVDGARLQP